MRIGPAFDGGGIPGIVAALIGEHIEQQVDGPLAPQVDILYGTSTGGIIALGASVTPQMSVRDMVRLYAIRGAEIFGDRKWLGWRRVLDFQYDQAPLVRILGEIFHDHVLGSLTVPTGITSYNLAHARPRFFKSWLDRDKGIKLTDAALATSAAWPVYFRPHIVDHEPLVDGGVVGNNPAAFCYADLANRYLGEEYTIISIGTGETGDSMLLHQALKGGLVRQGAHMVDVMFDGATDAFSYILRQVPRVRLLRLQPRLRTASHAMDEASAKNIAALRQDAVRFIEESMADETSQLHAAINILKERQ